MTLYKGTIPIAGLNTNKIVAGRFLFEPIWSDHIINDIQYLRADTFSWQSGDVYVTAYNTIEEEYSTGVEETEDGITFRRSANGYKIADASQEANILSKYNADGIAWYYILDTTNKRFKLPRTKYGFEGFRDYVGNDIAESLPNITANSNVGLGVQSGSPSVTGATSNIGYTDGYVTHLSGGANRYKVDYFNASQSSSTYKDGAPVQERATQMYLYFYVGEYAQPAIEQTAGINTELFNGKADINLNNINDTARITMAHNAMPSDKYIDLTLGASGTIYTAPADGFFFVKKVVGSDWYYVQMQVLDNNNVSMFDMWDDAYRTSPVALFAPVKKGQNIRIYYNATGTTNAFRFFYAQGSESEAQ